jgi:hypothetical protein
MQPKEEIPPRHFRQRNTGFEACGVYNMAEQTMVSTIYRVKTYYNPKAKITRYASAKSRVLVPGLSPQCRDRVSCVCSSIPSSPFPISWALELGNLDTEA